MVRLAGATVEQHDRPHTLRLCAPGGDFLLAADSAADCSAWRVALQAAIGEAAAPLVAGAAPSKATAGGATAVAQLHSHLASVYLGTNDDAAPAADKSTCLLM